MTAPTDTSAAARERQLAAYRSMGGSGRLLAALQMSEETRRIAMAGVCSRHPDWSHDRVERAVADLLLRAADGAVVADTAAVR
jgi:hypothetical protein